MSFSPRNPSSAVRLGPYRETDGSSSPPRSSWKYAWAGSTPHGMQTTIAPPPAGMGDAASNRLYTSARSSKSAREAMQAEVRSRVSSGAGAPNKQVSHLNPVSAQLAAGRYEDVMGKTIVGRYGKELREEASAAGDEAQAKRVAEVYNYGDMLFQESKQTQAKKEEWRRAKV